MKKILKKVVKSFGYELFPVHTLPFNVRQMNLFAYFTKMYATISAIEGDVVECGVGKGRTMLYLAFSSFIESKKRKVWGFDSFEGFPEPAPEDKSYRNPQKGDWSDTSVEMVLGQLRRAGIPSDFIATNVSLVKGFFPETFKQFPQTKIALLHVDVDLYQSYKDVLEYFYPYVVENGLILFDEYNEEKWPGAKQAVDEFLKEQGQTLQFDTSVHKYFIVKS
jgi:hypothetical protein